MHYSRRQHDPAFLCRSHVPITCQNTRSYGNGTKLARDIKVHQPEERIQQLQLLLLFI
uniref:Uncharacterized protein n=1 Tax=Utricularia reniformis TaxID=192314 RepID=A0A1Y0B1Z0_9LAMI|nr:hypothetical protein AEK19_MT1196 [Utricularia reniformis]ART31408.1 hypothetical protein AEK19_MT1196 [Utricularia reniformis]